MVMAPLHMVRRRRITTACFLDVIRAPCGGARVQDEAREEATARQRRRRRSRGDGRVRRHRPAHGVEANGVASGAAQVPVPA